MTGFLIGILVNLISAVIFSLLVLLWYIFVPWRLHPARAQLLWIYTRQLHNVCRIGYRNTWRIVWGARDSIAIPMLNYMGERIKIMSLMEKVTGMEASKEEMDQNMYHFFLHVAQDLAYTSFYRDRGIKLFEAVTTIDVNKALMDGNLKKPVADAHKTILGNEEEKAIVGNSRRD